YISGAVGIDEEITSVEALEVLSRISSDSTIFYTVSDFIYHPKLYLMSGEKQAIAVVGSANLTCDGLFRNVEFATVVHLDFEVNADFAVYKQYDAFISELLDVTHPNVQPINEDTLRRLANGSLIRSESQVKESGSPIVRSKKKNSTPPDVERLFPPIRVPVAPPGRKLPRLKTSPRFSVVIPPPTIGVAGTFIMKLSAFDSSHRSEKPGTPEVLIPQAAANFFPPIALSGKKHPDAEFDVLLNSSTGRERHRYRFWHYADRSEYRLRMDHDTIDLSNPNGGDLLVINKLSTPLDSDLLYEVTILPQNDPTFTAFLGLCKYEANGKLWGMTDV
ncbi:MAG TPA: restriction endonuclease PLD domain-containing protein, partial [Ktedonobacteraceae bacterium]|nr:restriction endonuclease PLD domain-containing protein [Ktedonobacteraceae bacterium]